MNEGHGARSANKKLKNLKAAHHLSESTLYKGLDVGP